MRRIDGLGAHLRHAHPVPGAGQRQLGVNRVTLAFGVFFIKQRRGDGIRQPIHGPFQRIVLNFQIERGTVGCGAGIVAAAVQL